MSDFEVKLGSVSMYCRTHKTDMIFLDDKEAVCPHCLSETANISLQEAISAINTEKKLRIFNKLNETLDF
jgi:Zn finger protein HypA/HybF involved in hydrogenase expression|tara:strand:+ start:282 stop:491 length:210 start_codon:yes stop_codon:yes gene_type:complete